MAGRKCRTCHHERRAEIEAGLSARVPLETLAARFGLSKAGLMRHRDGHMAPRVVGTVTDGQPSDLAPVRMLPRPDPDLATSDAGPLDVVAQLRAANDAVWAVLKDARAANDGRLVLFAVDRVVRQLEVQAALLVAAGGAPLDFGESPEWIAVQGALTDALDDHPEAAAAVALALADLDSA